MWLWVHIKYLFGCVLLMRIISCDNNFYLNKALGKCAKVHITISSLEEAYLELNWVTNCNRQSDRKATVIALYDKNPLEYDVHLLEPRALVQASKYPDGYYRTKVRFGTPWLPGSWEFHEHLQRADRGQHCFPYWIASFSDNFIVDAQCLRISPTWMSDNSQRIGNIRIGSLFIPGTHNSGSSELQAILPNYIMNQDRDVWTQLVFGIRYLDLRVGYYKHDGFYINHDYVKVTKLVPVLKQIRKFAEMAPKEIVVLDFHRFPYPTLFTKNMHEQLISLVNLHLGDLAVFEIGINKKGPTLNEIWAQNRSIIVCYGNREIANGKNYYEWLWEPIHQFWGDKRKVYELKAYLQSIITSQKNTLNPMFALMAELTPQPYDIIFRTNNLRVLADNTNRQLTKWFRDEWRMHEVNIVATDFFLGNDIINIAIYKNNELAALIK